ncbi:MAG: hypothetical protein ACW97X_07490 [Candidatus Hodarchaeales archaeon]|jgi:hypothetical protein
METPDIIASILVVLALIIAILSTPIRSAFGDMMGSTNIIHRNNCSCNLWTDIF